MKIRRRRRSAARKTRSALPETYVDYDEKPREYTLCGISSVVDVHTRVSDLYSNPLRPDPRTAAPNDRKRQGKSGKRAHQQRRLRPAQKRPARPSASRRAKARRRPTISTSCSPKSGRSLRSSSPTRAPSPLSARECTRRGVPPPTVTLFGSPFLTWRGIPLVPTDKLHVDGTKPKGRPAKPTSSSSASAKRNKASSVSSSPDCPASKRPASRCASWASTNAHRFLLDLAVLLGRRPRPTTPSPSLEDVEVGKYHEYK